MLWEEGKWDRRHQSTITSMDEPESKIIIIKIKSIMKNGQIIDLVIF
jgi:hypothetical protein